MIQLTDKAYAEVCLKIWGAVPVDKAWAIDTTIFKEALLQSKGVDTSKPETILLIKKVDK
jgi:hypothetical protein